jgi:hypothetical protein
MTENRQFERKAADENALRAGECPRTTGCALNEPIHPMTLGT